MHVRQTPRSSLGQGVAPGDISLTVLPRETLGVNTALNSHHVPSGSLSPVHYAPLHQPSECSQDGPCSSAPRASAPALLTVSTLLALPMHHSSPSLSPPRRRDSWQPGRAAEMNSYRCLAQQLPPAIVAEISVVTQLDHRMFSFLCT